MWQVSCQEQQVQCKFIEKFKLFFIDANFFFNRTSNVAKINVTQIKEEKRKGREARRERAGGRTFNFLILSKKTLSVL
jgi:hypothetical protein